MEFASSLKALGWFVQVLFDKCLTATLQHYWGVIADKPDLKEALRSLLDELNSVQAMLSLAQNFGGQHNDLLEFLKDVMDAAYEADDLLSELDYYRLEQQVDDSEDEDLHRKVDYRLQKASTSSTPSSFHDINKATIVKRIHQIVSRLEDLVNCLSEALSLLDPELGLRANPNVFPVASHPLTTSFLLSNQGNHFEDLPESESLSVFNKSAFGDEDPGDHLELDEIAKQIAGKLDGSLLAAKIVGGLLRDNLDEQHWRSVLCSDIWQQRRSADDIMPILRFSYHHLPAQLQQCFAHCGFFPKNWEFKKVDLVGMWISQGYIHTKSGGNMSPEEIGSEYFDHLVSKSFIQAINPSITSETFALHELLHDLAESVSEDEFLRINSKGTTKFTSRVRHIFVHTNDLSLLRSCNLRNLRTLTLEIDTCPQLVSLFTAQTEVRMSKLTSLRELVIVWCGRLVSVELKSCPSLEKLQIISCDRIQLVPLLPPTLDFLEISSLEMLTAFSMEQEENLSDLTSLITISIYNCPRLRSLPIMPASLQELSIEKCPELRRETYQKGGDDWHKICHVPTVDWC